MSDAGNTNPHTGEPPLRSGFTPRGPDDHNQGRRKWPWVLGAIVILVIFAISISDLQLR